MPSPFTPGTFTFLREIRSNNNKPWFEQNRERYHSLVRDPFLSFIRDLNPQLKTISEYYHGVEKSHGGALFRIYRDTRFSKDKTPYKSWIGARFTHTQAGRQGAPMYYLHLQPDNVFFAAGLWRPATPMATRIRSFLQNNPAAWKTLKTDPGIKAHFSWGGDQLKRTPRGFDATHELMDDIRRKDFVLTTPFTEAQACSGRFVSLVLKRCKQSAPLVDYLCAALDQEF